MTGEKKRRTHVREKGCNKEKRDSSFPRHSSISKYFTISLSDRYTLYPQWGTDSQKYHCHLIHYFPFSFQEIADREICVACPRPHRDWVGCKIHLFSQLPANPASWPPARVRLSNTTWSHMVTSQNLCRDRKQTSANVENAINQFASSSCIQTTSLTHLNQLNELVFFFLLLMKQT